MAQRLFERRHACVEPQEIGFVDVRRVDTIVAQFTEESAIAPIGAEVDLSEVTGAVVGSAAVDVVDGHAGSDWSHPCDIVTSPVSLSYV